MNTKNLSYISLEFSEEQKKKISIWAKEFIGEVEENVTDDLHLTVFYGLNDDLLDDEKLNDVLSHNTISDVVIGKVETFSLPSQSYKVVYFSIENTEKIKNLHEKLKEFPYFEEYQKLIYTPHITIAFVNKDFDTSKLSYTGSKIFSVKKVTRHMKAKS